MPPCLEKARRTAGGAVHHSPRGRLSWRSDVAFAAAGGRYYVVRVKHLFGQPTPGWCSCCCCFRMSRRSPSARVQSPSLSMDRSTACMHRSSGRSSATDEEGETEYLEEEEEEAASAAAAGRAASGSRDLSMSPPPPRRPPWRSVVSSAKSLSRSSSCISSSMSLSSRRASSTASISAHAVMAARYKMPLECALSRRAPPSGTLPLLLSECLSDHSRRHLARGPIGRATHFVVV